MLIHDNIRYLREAKKLSQHKFARKLGLKRGNIASYEGNTMPSLKTIVKISEWYNISVDDLLKVNLADPRLWEKKQKPASQADFAKRLEDLIKYLEISIDEFAASIDLNVEEVITLSKRKKGSKPRWSMDAVISLANAYPWLSLEWFIRGEGVMVNTFQMKATAVAEPATTYATTESMEAIKILIDKLNGRIVALERKLGE